METKFFHSVTLDRDACRGCINCIKRCPTEAIRVRGGKAKSSPTAASTAANASGCARITPRSPSSTTWT